MKKTLIMILIALALAFSACGQPAEPQTPADAPPQNEEAPAEAAQPELDPADISVLTLKGPTGVGMAYLLENGGYNAQVATAGDQVVAALASGEAQIAAIATNLAAKLYAKTNGDIRMLALGTYGTLYIVERGHEVQSLADLDGRSIALAGEGSLPQYMLEYLLDSAGINCQLTYYSEHSETATLLASGQIDLALLPEPNVTATLAKDDSLRVALDIGGLWQETAGVQTAMSCVVASKTFVEENPLATAKFLEDMAASIYYALDDVSGAAALCEKFEIIPSAALAEKAIPQCSLCFVEGREMRDTITSFYDILLDYDPASLGGALPGEDFYYIPAE